MMAERIKVRDALEAYFRWLECPDYQSPSMLDGNAALTETRGHKRAKGQVMACKETRVSRKPSGPTPSNLADRGRRAYRQLEIESPVKAQLVKMDHFADSQSQVVKAVKILGMELSERSIIQHIREGKMIILAHL